jgi:hypothetical protein
MINYYFFVAISYSIGLAALIGIIRFKKILKAYYPFVYVTCLAFITEIISTVCTLIFKTSIIVTNNYVLIEALLYVWLFHNWGALQSRKWHYPAMIISLILVWVYDIIFWHRFVSLASFFHVCYSFALIFLAIAQINKMIVRERGNILKASAFLISAGIIIFYTYDATIEVFFLFQLKVSDNFYRNVYLIMEFINFFANLIFALAALWIPTRQKFTMSS